MLVTTLLQLTCERQGQQYVRRAVNMPDQKLKFRSRSPASIRERQPQAKVQDESTVHDPFPFPSPFQQNFNLGTCMLHPRNGHPHTRHTPLRVQLTMLKLRSQRHHTCQLHSEGWSPLPTRMENERKLTKNPKSRQPEAIMYSTGTWSRRE